MWTVSEFSCSCIFFHHLIEIMDFWQKHHLREPAFSMHVINILLLVTLVLMEAVSWFKSDSKGTVFSVALVVSSLVKTFYLFY